MIGPGALAAASHRLLPQLEPHVRRTPTLALAGPEAGRRVFAKCENLQVTGSFKARGALAALLTARADGIRHVVTASTGNHGVAVAYAGRLLDMPVAVYAPATALPSKLAAIRRWGGSVTLVDGDPLNAELAARATAGDQRRYVSPYNDPAVIAGQGTIGVELLEQVPDLDTVVAAVGGGGLISGIAAVIRTARPRVRVVGASPANSAAMLESVQAGQIIEVTSAPTLSDATAGGLEAGTVTFPLCRALVDTWIRVEEPQIQTAIRRHVRTHDQVIEGAAGVALAAVQELDADSGTTAVVLCGANIDDQILDEILD